MVGRRATGFRGQATVEFALLLPLFLAFVFVLFEVGRLFGSWVLITNAAREGARFAVIQSSSCPNTASCISSIQSRVQQVAQFLSVQTVNCQSNQPPSGSSSCVSVFYSSSTSTDCPTDSSTDNFYCVQVAYNVQTLMPITGQIPWIGSINYPGFIEVVGFSKMRAE
jgi:Flp pilus assembly protein TadG